MGVLTIDGHTIDTNEPIPFTLATKQERIKAGIAAARSKGQKWGRPTVKKSVVRKVAKALKKGYSVSEVQKFTKASRGTVSRIRQRLNADGELPTALINEDLPMRTIAEKAGTSTFTVQKVKKAMNQVKAGEQLDKSTETLTNILKEDMVNSPPHYNQHGVECIDAIRAATDKGYKYYLLGNIIKYLWRFDYKGKPVEDLKKAKWYLEKLIEHVDS